jgi:hypothetical protein
LHRTPSLCPLFKKTVFHTCSVLLSMYCLNLKCKGRRLVWILRHASKVNIISWHAKIQRLTKCMWLKLVFIRRIRHKNLSRSSRVVRKTVQL